MEWRTSIDAATVIRQTVAGLFSDRKVLAAPRRCASAGSVEAIRDRHCASIAIPLREEAGRMQATTPVSPPLNGGDAVSASRARRRATGRLRPVTAPVESIGDARATRVATPLSQLPKLVCPIRAHAPEGSK